MTFADRIWRGLRSRRLAVALIVTLSVYTVVTTVVPRGSAQDPKVSAWAVAHPIAESIAAPMGLHRAYVSPFFLALAALLAVCTAACATERTIRAVRLMRGMGPFDRDGIMRLAGAPQLTFDIDSDVEPGEALSAAAEGLRGLGLRVESSDVMADGRSGRLGLLGSPFFHWSIVAFMLVVALGQASRAEGFLPLPVGQRVVDEKASYLQITEGPLFAGRYSGLEFEASELPRRYVAGGIDRGATPLVHVYRSGVEVTSGYIYANNPLRIGTLMVHMVEFGPSVTLSLESSGGAEVARESFLLDRSTETSSGTKPTEFRLSTAPGSEGLSMRIQVPTRASSASTATPPPASKVLLETSVPGTGSYASAVAVVEGEALDLPGGERLRVADVGDWARVSVANDWSVGFIYGLLILSIAGLSVAVLVPTRRATVLLVEGQDGWSLKARAWHSMRDPSFKARVTDAVRLSASSREAE